MRSDATLYTLKKIETIEKYEVVVRKADIVCLRCNAMKGIKPSSKKLVFVALVMSAFWAPLAQGTGLPFRGMEQTPRRQNCTNEEMCAQRVDLMKEHTLATIQSKILDKLGLENKPEVTRVPEEVTEKAVRIVLQRSNHRSEPAFPGGYFAEVSEIVSFAEEPRGT